MSIREMISQIDSLAKKEYGRGATEQQIADAERALEVRFPASYRAFLAKYGWAQIHHDPIFGVGPSVPSVYRLVRKTRLERYDAEPNIPHHLVPVMNDGAGNHYCLDTANFRGDECPVVFWDHDCREGADQTPSQVSPSFDQWLIDLIVDNPCKDDP